MFFIEELLITDTVFFVKFGILFLIISYYYGIFFLSSGFIDELRILSFSYIHMHET